MALKKAASKTGPMSKNMAIKETVTSRRKATTLYPIKLDRENEIAVTNSIKETLNTYCCLLLNLCNRKLDTSMILYHKCRRTNIL